MRGSSNRESHRHSQQTPAPRLDADGSLVHDSTSESPDKSIPSTLFSSPAAAVHLMIDYPQSAVNAEAGHPPGGGGCSEGGRAALVPCHAFAGSVGAAASNASDYKPVPEGQSYNQDQLSVRDTLSQRCWEILTERFSD